MRANGVPERYCTGDAAPKEKFQAWARTVPYTLRNPLYHWTHLELKRYFGIDELLDESSAPRVWEQANAALAKPELSAHGILAKFHVKAVCTTDDPTDDLSCHKAIAASGIGTKVFPTFRPDKALNVHLPEVFNPWVERLEDVSNINIGRFSRFHSRVAANGTTSSTRWAVAFPITASITCSPTSRRSAKLLEFSTRRAPVARQRPSEHARFASHLMYVFGRFDAESGWTKQLHIGARRNNNSRRFSELGPDTGFDSIGDWPQADALGAYLDRLDRDNSLPKVVIYNLNPADNYVDRDDDRQFPGRHDCRARSKSAAGGGISTRRRRCSGR